MAICGQYSFDLLRKMIFNISVVNACEYFSHSSNYSVQRNPHQQQNNVELSGNMEPCTSTTGTPLIIFVHFILPILSNETLVMTEFIAKEQLISKSSSDPLAMLILVC